MISRSKAPGFSAAVRPRRCGSLLCSFLLRMESLWFMEPMGLGVWVAIFLLSSLWWKWILSWGGAAWLEGIKAWIGLGWFAGAWTAEQIRLYALCCWVLEGGWFAIGVFVPGARFAG